MKSPEPHLIVGAGPVGLAAALFLARAGIPTRIIDRAVTPSRLSKALAVNPRTLELLEPTGVTARMLEDGLIIRGARFSFGSERGTDLSFEGLPHKYPFMLALSQAATEHLLDEALRHCGVTVERGVELIDCEQDEEGVHATLMHGGGGIESVACPWLVAADGAHSAVRDHLGLGFPGSSFGTPWHLADMALDTTLESNRAHVFLLEGGGFLFLIRVIDQEKGARGPQLWRLISDRPDPARWLAHGKPVAPPVWESEFHVSHRICPRLREGRISLAGDAAHIHSPIGARGMNLGIEDAWVLAQCMIRGRTLEYESLRRPVVASVVRRVEMLSRMARGESAIERILRATLLRSLVKLPLIRWQMLKTVTGLEHGLPDFGTECARERPGVTESLSDC